jgi:hypothetical protein
MGVVGCLLSSFGISSSLPRPACDVRSERSMEGLHTKQVQDVYLILDAEPHLDFRVPIETWSGQSRPYALCSQCVESSEHLFVTCPFSRELWFKCFHCSGWHHLSPTAGDMFTGWWLQSRKRVPKARRRAFDSLVILVVWCIWLERNSCVFRNITRSLSATLTTVLSSCDLWCRTQLVDRLHLLM